MKKLQVLKEGKPLYDFIITSLTSSIDKKLYYRLCDFEPIIRGVLGKIDGKIIAKVIEGLSIMDKDGEIHKDKKGNIIYDKETKDTEIVKWNEKINDYMLREVFPHIPDAKAFFEGNDINAKHEDDRNKKIIKIGAEIPFTRFFYKYIEPTSSDEILKQFQDLESNVQDNIKKLF